MYVFAGLIDVNDLKSVLLAATDLILCVKGRNRFKETL